LAVGPSALNAAALFGASNSPGQSQAGAGPEANNYWVDMLFRPVPADANAATNVTPAATTATQPDTEARAEAGRIVTFGLAHGQQLSQDDYNELVRLVSQSTGANPGEAGRRVNNMQTRMHQQELNTAEAARRVVKDISLWLAASLIFGALVAAGAAVSGRWEDDKARG
jgi:maltoporin